MTYKIFISYAVQEEELAKKLLNLLNISFKGKVSFFFISDNIVAGEKWKDKIQTALKECNSILTILTPTYILRPWAYIEWSAFWLSNKPTFIVTTDDLSAKDVIDPMRDSQIVGLFNEDSVKKLIEAIAREIQSEYVPYEFANDIAFQTKAVYGKIIETKENENYLFYKTDISLLPSDDLEKRKIFLYYYNNNLDRAFLKQIFEKINDNALKTNLLLFLLDKSEMELIEETFFNVETKLSLKPLFKELNERGYSTSQLSEKILEYISKSQTALRSFGEYLVSNGNIEDRIFSNLIDLFTSMSEFRKLCEYVIDNSLHNTNTFRNMLERFYGKNHTELHKLLNYWIKSSNYDKEEITQQILKLSKNNKAETMKVLLELVYRDKELVKVLVFKEGVITKEENIQKIRELVE
jgi:hypothetical protein